MAINVNNDLSWFDHIVPCGIPDKGVTSLAQELSTQGLNVTMEEAEKEFLHSFSSLFNCDLIDETDEEEVQMKEDNVKI